MHRRTGETDRKQREAGAYTCTFNREVKIKTTLGSVSTSLCLLDKLFIFLGC